MSQQVSPRELLEPRLRELLSGTVTVEVRQSFTSPRFTVRLYDAGRNLAIDELLDRQQFWDMIERDGTGWDSYGVHGMEAMLLTVAMLLDPQYDDRPGRIPAPESGWRLNRCGDRWCQLVATEFARALKEAGEAGGP